MKTNTRKKFEKWCNDIGASNIGGFVCDEDDFPCYSIHDNECSFHGEYDEGFFILKLIDYSETPSTGATNGIEIRELVWNEEHEDYRWYAEGRKSNIYIIA